MQEPPLYQIVALQPEGKRAVLSRHAPREVAELVAAMLKAEGFRQIRIEPEDEYCQRAA